MAVCSEIHTKHINIVCGQNVELLNVKLVVHKCGLKMLSFKFYGRKLKRKCFMCDIPCACPQVS
jgi:hypothetical protein